MEALTYLILFLFSPVYIPAFAKCARSTFVKRIWKSHLLSSLISFYPASLEVTPFFDVTPAMADFKCICRYKSRSGFGRCGYRPAGETCSVAEGLRRGLSICPPSHAAFTRMLDHFARACLCKHRHHKKEVVIRTIVDHWAKELEAKYNRILSQEGSSQLVPGAFDVCFSKPTDSVQSSAIAQRYKALFGITTEEALLDQDDLDEVDESNDEAHSLSAVPWQFQPYPGHEPSNAALEELIWSRLKPSEQHSGYIYAFTRSGDEDHIKIGYTTCTLEERMEQWSLDCKYRPIVLVSEGLVSNAKRVERLIHKDLESRSLRRCETRCRTNPNCKKRHREWFQISEGTARETIRHWVEWMGLCRPYGSNGQLCDAKILAMHLPPDLVEDDVDMRRLVSDSSGRPWATSSGDIQKPLKATPVRGGSPSRNTTRYSRSSLSTPVRTPVQGRRRTSAPASSAASSSRRQTSPSPLPTVAKCDFMDEYSWTCERCSYHNAMDTTICEMCRLIAPGYELTPEPELPPIPTQPNSEASNGRKRRRLLELATASDPVLPQPRDIVEISDDEEESRPTRKGKVARRGRRLG